MFDFGMHRFTLQGSFQQTPTMIRQILFIQNPKTAMPSPESDLLHTVNIPELLLENGQTLHELTVSYQCWGRLNEAKDNVLVVCHALTGNTNVADWWDGVLGAGKMLDTDRYFVICMNVLGSCYGTTGPDSRNPKTGQKYRADFPMVTVRDSVRLHRAVLAQLGITRVASVVGGSMGGMQALEWAILFPELVESLVVIASSGRHSAWCIGWSEAQRQAIYADPNWQNGYYTDAQRPDAGLAAARMSAMISYRSWASFQARFGRETQSGGAPETFKVESYQRYQGQKITQRFDALSYVRLTQLMDLHDVSADRGAYEQVLQNIRQPAFIMGIESDLLYPLVEQEELAEHLPHAEFRILHSDAGHDAFLIEFEQLNTLIHPWMEQVLSYKGASPSTISSSRLKKVA